MTHADRAIQFLTAARAGEVVTARALCTATAIHHNQYFAAGMNVLIDAIAAAAVDKPASTFSVKRIVCDDAVVVLHSHASHAPGEPGYTVFHMFRFDGDLIAELWDVGQMISPDMPNTDGVF
jgi:predicted SnoaL-like aldol condensation-catalyzing enzyme